MVGNGNRITAEGTGLFSNLNDTVHAVGITGMNMRVDLIPLLTNGNVTLIECYIGIDCRRAAVGGTCFITVQRQCCYASVNSIFHRQVALIALTAKCALKRSFTEPFRQVV